MAENYIYVEHVPAMERLRRSPTGHVGRYITKQTRQTRFNAHAGVPKPGGPGGGRTKINFSTGQLMAGIRHEVVINNGELEGRVIAIPDHALFVHEGTPPHVIKAKRAPNLVFFWHKVGHVVAFKKVNHPGQPPNPFLLDGLKRAFNRIG